MASHKLQITALILAFFSSSTFANAGPSTVSISYLGLSSDALEKAGASRLPEFSQRATQAGDSFGQPAAISGGSPKDPKGLAFSFRHEFDNTWGVIVEGGYATDDGTMSYRMQKQLPDQTTSVASGKLDVTGNFAFLGAGPTLRFNDVISIYAMATGNYKTIKYDENHIRTRDSASEGYSNTFSASQDKFDVGYAVGAQFNVYHGLVIDASYAMLGSGDWKASGFTVGVGYNF